MHAPRDLVHRVKEFVAKIEPVRPFRGSCLKVLRALVGANDVSGRAADGAMLGAFRGSWSRQEVAEFPASHVHHLGGRLVCLANDVGLMPPVEPRQEVTERPQLVKAGDREPARASSNFALSKSASVRTLT